MRILVKNLANILTTFNLLCGTFAIFSALNQQFILACSLMVVGTFIDVLDGYAAHKTKNTSQLGENLDMLADLTTFGLAPTIMLYVYYDADLFITISSVMLLICGAWRLARQATQKPSNYLVGVPIDISAYLVSVLVLFDATIALAGFSVIVLSSLFISRLRVPRLIKR